MATTTVFVFPKDRILGFDVSPGNINKKGEAIVSSTTQGFGMVGAQVNPAFESAIASNGMDGDEVDVFYFGVDLFKEVSPNINARHVCFAATNVIGACIINFLPCYKCC
ncbi:hypothetical protein BX070DRAFT_227774 [Coemansia spiralis]|nr:hypothetical protein BX070DRAFT_227774 [Coemansia spiralis]